MPPSIIANAPSSEWFHEADGFPRPDWEAIWMWVESEVAEDDLKQAWDEIAQLWLSRLGDRLGPDYEVHESPNFLLLASVSDRNAVLLLRFLERSLGKILYVLGEAGQDEGCGRLVVLMFDKQDDYLLHVCHFYREEEEMPPSAGVFLGDSHYSHIALPQREMQEVEQTAAHELVHACLEALPIPRWLNEGLASTLERAIVGYGAPQVDHERMQEHLDFWCAEGIQEFWSAGSFDRADKPQELSYDLAQIVVHMMSGDVEQFRRFVADADREDAGESAAREHFDAGLGDILGSFLGDGEWAPQPASWERTLEEPPAPS